MPYANNKDADQPAHPRSLISAFAVRFLDSIIPSVSTSEISRLLLASVAEQPVCVLPGRKPEDRFSRDEAQISQGKTKGYQTNKTQRCSFNDKDQCQNNLHVPKRKERK